MISSSRCNHLALLLFTPCFYFISQTTGRNHTTWHYPPPGSSLTINYGDTVIPSWNSTYEDLYTGTTTLEAQLYVFCGDDTYYGPDAVSANGSHPYPFVDMSFSPDLDPLPTNCSFGLGYQPLDGIVNEQTVNLSTPITLTNKTKEIAQTWSSGSPSTRTASNPSATSSRVIQTATASGAVATVLATPTSVPSSSGSSGLSAGAKIGISVAGVVVLILILVGLLVWLRHKKQSPNTRLNSAGEQQQQPSELADERRDVSELPPGERRHEMSTVERYEMPADSAPTEMGESSKGKAPMR
ncbi:hypothetical protein MMC20_007130 [Loxospora ochrophaea]|nr:hypothetical protein [Loxospora ochrophaea]